MEKVIPLVVRDLLGKAKPSLTRKQQTHAMELLLRYTALFASSDKDLGKVDVVKHSINTGNRPPIKQRPHRHLVHMQPEIDEHIDDMLDRGVIEKSSGPWAPGIVLVKGKTEAQDFVSTTENSMMPQSRMPIPSQG